MNNIPQEALNIIMGAKGSSFRNSIKTSMQIGRYDSYDRNAHNSDESEVNLVDLNEFCQVTYSDWRNEMIANIDKLSGEKKVLAEAMRDDPKYYPENISARGGPTPFYDFCTTDYLSTFKGVRQPAIRLQNDRTFIPDGETKPDNFLHVMGWAIPDQQRQKEEARLYLNLKSKNITKFCTEFYKKCRANSVPHYFKFSACDNRNDTIVVYTSYENMSKYVEIIEEIKAARQDLFEGAESTNPNVAVINGNIGFAEEPEVQDEKGGKYSFNSLREKAVNEVSDTIRKETRDKFKKPLGQQAFGRVRGNYENFDTCCEYLIDKYLQTLLSFDDQKFDVDSKLFLTQFKRALQKAILSDGKIGDVECGGARLRTSEIDVIQDIINLTGKTFENRTQMKAHLARCMMFTSPNGFNPEEQKLMSTMHSALVKGLHEDVNSNNPAVKDKAEMFLERLGNDVSEIDDTGKALLILSSAQFMATGRVELRNNKGDGLSYNDAKLEVFEGILGKDRVDEIIDSTCEKYSISDENLHLNRTTQSVVDTIKAAQKSEEKIDMNEYRWAYTIPVDDGLTL